MVAKYPVYKIEDIYHFDKYGNPLTMLKKVWLWFQLIVLLLLISHLFGNIATIGKPDMFYYGLFIFVYVYAMAEYMDNSKYSWVWEGLKLISGFGMLYFSKDWFGAGRISSAIPYTIGIYLVISFTYIIYITVVASKVKGSLL